jgi:hypothetical protein
VAECGSAESVDQICTQVSPELAAWQCPVSHPLAIGLDCSECLYCADNEYCDSQYNLCDGWGECVAKTACGGTLRPACGCDGVTYSTKCAAAEVGGVDIGEKGCAPPSSDWFSCGPWFCLRASEYCETQLGDQNDVYYQCVEFPADCPAPACSCLEDLPCALSSFRHLGCSEAAGVVHRSCAI